MKCPKEHCGGTMYRFRPHHLVETWAKACTGVTLELREGEWKQVGMMCDTCGYMEFYTQDPQHVLRLPTGYFESTEPTREHHHE